VMTLSLTVWNLSKFPLPKCQCAMQKTSLRLARMGKRRRDVRVFGIVRYIARGFL
jgi:hypothetical protein